MTAARLPGIARLFLRIGTGVVAIWIAGFAWFLYNATRPADPPPPADGIVVLTGGAERVETALKLLDGGLARILLISGVNRSSEFAAIAQRAGFDLHLSDRVTLGRSAADTRQNAAETAAWARENDIHSLIVVTAGYHMPRALAELSRALPEVELYQYPILSPVLRGQFTPSSLRLLASEYTKWLATEAWLSGFGPHELRHAARDQDPRAQRGNKDVPSG